MTGNLELMCLSKVEQVFLSLTKAGIRLKKKVFAYHVKKNIDSRFSFNALGRHFIVRLRVLLLCDFGAMLMTAIASMIKR